jgi:5'-3' exonuclease
MRQQALESGRRLLATIKSSADTMDAKCLRKLKYECLNFYQRGLGVTHEMEKLCIAGLRKMGVTVIVAPFEADPQLAYLCHIGFCDGVMTEDSDIIVYSAGM